MYSVGVFFKAEGGGNLLRPARAGGITAQPHPDSAKALTPIDEPEVVNQGTEVVFTRSGIALVLPGEGLFIQQGVKRRFRFRLYLYRWR